MIPAAPPPLSPPPVLVGQAAVRPAAVRPVTSILGVLRRRQRQGDLDPTLLSQLARQAHSPIDSGLFGTPVVSLLRLAAVTPWGQRIFLITYLPPTQGQHRRLPAKYRGVTVAHQVSVAFSPLASSQAIPAILDGGRAWSTESAYDVDRPGDRFVFLFPDGVTRVALWNARSTAAHPHPLVTPHSRPVIVSVHGNVAAFQSSAFRSPGHEVWYGSTGNVVKRIANASSCAPPLGSCG